MDEVRFPQRVRRGDTRGNNTGTGRGDRLVVGALGDSDGSKVWCGRLGVVET